jgi:nucleoid DNA-binding protein
LKSEYQIKLTLQQILQQHLSATTKLNSYQRSVLTKLQQCKTPDLGGHWQACNECGVIQKHYNSCGNRHCPQCQGANRERWILEREYDLFDVPHHHVTFTVPRELRSLFYQNQRLLYDLLFKSMWATLCSFSKDPRSRLQAEIGVISILHTWTQRLEYHPHLHCIVPSGGLTTSGHWKEKDGKFLFLVKSLNLVFKTKFCDELEKLHNGGVIINKLQMNNTEFASFIIELKRKKWVVNSKPGFAGRASVLEYLGRYTHKIAISNYRLISLKDGQITFTFRDRKAGDINKEMSLPVDEFIKQISRHVLPKQFIKIRHYGYFSTRTKKVKLALIRKALGEAPKTKPAKLTIAEVIFRTTGHDIHLCPFCKAGMMIVIKEIPAARGSPMQWPKQMNKS